MRCARELVVAVALAIMAVACDDGDAPDDVASTDEGSSSDASDSSGSSSTGDMIEWASLDERPCPDDSLITWENFGGGYVISYCTTCHHSALPADTRQLAPIAMNFETIELVRAHAPRMWARAGDQNATMPPVGAPGPDERQMFGEWLACGAPTNADLGME